MDSSTNLYTPSRGSLSGKVGAVPLHDTSRSSSSLWSSSMKKINPKRLLFDIASSSPITPIKANHNQLIYSPGSVSSLCDVDDDKYDNNNNNKHQVIPRYPKNGWYEIKQKELTKQIQTQISLHDNNSVIQIRDKNGEANNRSHRRGNLEYRQKILETCSLNNNTNHQQEKKGRVMTKNKKAQRSIRDSPIGVLDAPGIAEDTKLQVMDWSVLKFLAVALGPKLFALHIETKEVHEICDLQNVKDVEPDYIRAIKWSPDGLSIAVVGYRNSLSIIDFETGQMELNLKFQHPISTLDWIHNCIAIGLQDGSVELLPLLEYKACKDLSIIPNAHDFTVLSLKWNSDARTLATGGDDKQVAVWDVRKLSQSRWKYKHHNDGVQSLAWCKWDASILASGGAKMDKLICLWSANKETKPFMSSQSTSGAVTNLLWSSSYYKEICCTHDITHSPPPSHLGHHLSLWKFSHNITQSKSNLSHAIDLANIHTKAVISMSIAEDDNIVYTAAADEEIKSWDFWNMSNQQKKKMDRLEKEAATQLSSPSFLGSFKKMGIR